MCYMFHVAVTQGAEHTIFHYTNLLFIVCCAFRTTICLSGRINCPTLNDLFTSCRANVLNYGLAYLLFLKLAFVSVLSVRAQ